MALTKRMLPPRFLRREWRFAHADDRLDVLQRHSAELESSSSPKACRRVDQKKMTPLAEKEQVQGDG